MVKNLDWQISFQIQPSRSLINVLTYIAKHGLLSYILSSRFNFKEFICFEKCGFNCFIFIVPCLEHYLLLTRIPSYRYVPSTTSPSSRTWGFVFLDFLLLILLLFVLVLFRLRFQLSSSCSS